MIDHLVIGDGHVKPGQDFSRFTALGNYIVEHKPKVVIFLGDFADMPSLSSYDRGTRGFVGRRYHEDVESVQEALAILFKPLCSFNNKRKKNKKKQWWPRMIMLGGNHDDARIKRAVEADHVLEGTIGIEDLGYENYFEYHPYLDIVNVDGVNYTHCVKHKNSAMMVSGMHHAHALLQKRHASFTVGHSHLLDYKTDIIEGGKRMHGLVAGCFFEHDEDYAVQNTDCWWRGVVHKRDVKEGEYNPEFISLARLKELYG